jgi:hypothetical protein
MQVIMWGFAVIIASVGCGRVSMMNLKLTMMLVTSAYVESHVSSTWTFHCLYCSFNLLKYCSL